jgi:hypothetical protein
MWHGMMAEPARPNLQPPKLTVALQRIEIENTI